MRTRPHVVAAQESIALGQHVEHADREIQSGCFGLRFEDREYEVLFFDALEIGDVQLAREFDELGARLVFELLDGQEIHLFSILGFERLGLWRLEAFLICAHREDACAAIVVVVAASAAVAVAIETRRPFAAVKAILTLTLGPLVPVGPFDALRPIATVTALGPFRAVRSLAALWPFRALWPFGALWSFCAVRSLAALHAFNALGPLEIDVYLHRTRAGAGSRTVDARGGREFAVGIRNWGIFVLHVWLPPDNI